MARKCREGNVKQGDSHHFETHYKLDFLDIFNFGYFACATIGCLPFKRGATNQDVLLTEACYCSRLYSNNIWIKSG